MSVDISAGPGQVLLDLVEPVIEMPTDGYGIAAAWTVARPRKHQGVRVKEEAAGRIAAVATGAQGEDVVVTVIPDFDHGLGPARFGP